MLFPSQACSEYADDLCTYSCVEYYSYSLDPPPPEIVVGTQNLGCPDFDLCELPCCCCLRLDDGPYLSNCEFYRGGPIKKNNGTMTDAQKQAEKVTELDKADQN